MAFFISQSLFKFISSYDLKGANTGTAITLIAETHSPKRKRLRSLSQIVTSALAG